MDTWNELLTTMAMSQTGPDFTYGWSNQTSIIVPGRNEAYASLNDLIPQDMYDLVAGWPGVTDTDGSIYGIPFALTAHAFAFNKIMFDEAGIDYSDHPKIWGWDELVDISDKLLAAGIQPIAFANKEGYLGEWWICGSASSYFDSNAEMAKYFQEESMNSQPWLDILDKFKTMYDRGYFFEGGNTLDFANNARQQMSGGKAAMQMAVGSFYKVYTEELGQGNVGVTNWPIWGDGELAKSKNGVFTQVFGITNFSEHKEEAVLAIRELVATEWGADYVWEFYGELPVYKNWEFTPSGIGEDYDIYMEWASELIGTPGLETGDYTYDVWSAEFAEVFYRLNPQFLTGDITAEEFAEELDIARGIK